MTAHYRDGEVLLASHTLPTALPSLSRRPGLYRNGAKRALDVILVMAALPIVVPIILALAIIVMCDGHSPFYTQPRVGRSGREFRFWKLRSMVHDADTLLAAHLASNPAAQAEWEFSQKLKCDPRITRIGRFLRKSSLDELPQLWNVLKGDMSLVGPRPIMPKQSLLYPGKAYYILRPGLTGPWQISDRNECSFALRADFDSAYDRDLSLSLDVQILVATIGVVLRGTGY